MKKIRVSTGIYWVEIPEAELFILCGCPADSVKHLMKSGLITSREKDGKTFESGPNAVLLSDLALQNQRFSNLAEFPVLQMLYRQGMAIPGHPNNTGVKPMIIGLEEQVKSQAEYIYLGNYGLASLEEIMAAGIP
ncbi:MAG: cyclic nucleotide-binding protein, partial [Spirochaetales bacterium]